MGEKIESDPPGRKHGSGRNRGKGVLGRSAGRGKKEDSYILEGEWTQPREEQIWLTSDKILFYLARKRGQPRQRKVPSGAHPGKHERLRSREGGKAPSLAIKGAFHHFQEKNPSIARTPCVAWAEEERVAFAQSGEANVGMGGRKGLHQEGEEAVSSGRRSLPRKLTRHRTINCDPPKRRRRGPRCAAFWGGGGGGGYELAHRCRNVSRLSRKKGATHPPMRKETACLCGAAGWKKRAVHQKKGVTPTAEEKGAVLSKRSRPPAKSSKVREKKQHVVGKIYLRSELRALLAKRGGRARLTKKSAPRLAKKDRPFLFGDSVKKQHPARSKEEKGLPGRILS